ncbi:hypothetical protein IWW36_006096, partial [Coemansia brasiliensis]
MRSAGNVAGTNDGNQVRETPAASNVQQIDYGKGADDDVISTSSSAFSTPSATPTSGAPEMSPDNGNAQTAASGPNKSAMKKPAKNGAVDPLDIIRAGLARRTTLKNQQRQQQQQHQRLNLPQRSATMKQMGTQGHADNIDGDDSGPSSNQSRLAGQLRSNLGAEQRTNGPSPGPPPGAQVARTEIIMPVIQRSNTDIALETSPTEYASSLSPEYYANASEQHQPPPSAFSSSSAVMQHPGMTHVQSSSNSPMMTPPLSYEEMAARGVSGINISQKSQQQPLNTYGSSSSATISPSPASPAPGNHQYGSLNGTVAGSLRRAPTKKDSMKVKVHYNEAIVNLM